MGRFRTNLKQMRVCFSRAPIQFLSYRYSSYVTVTKDLCFDQLTNDLHEAILSKYIAQKHVLMCAPHAEFSHECFPVTAGNCQSNSHTPPPFPPQPSRLVLWDLGHSRRKQDGRHKLSLFVIHWNVLSLSPPLHTLCYFSSPSFEAAVAVVEHFVVVAVRALP